MKDLLLMPVMSTDELLSIINMQKELIKEKDQTIFFLYDEIKNARMKIDNAIQPLISYIASLEYELRVKKLIIKAYAIQDTRT